MRRLREAVRQKRKDLWANNSWILHHDNAPLHNAIREFLTKNETNTIQQPLNSPDMAPCDFFLFDRVKKPLRGTRLKPKEGNGKIEDGSDGYIDNRVPEMFRELDQALA